MNDHRLIERAIKNAQDIITDERATGPIRARAERIVKFCTEAIAQPDAPEWSRDDRLNISAPDGGWLKRGRHDGGYSMDTSIVKLPPDQRAEIIEAWSGHYLPLQLQSTKAIAGDPYDYWDDPDHVLSVFEEIVAGGVRILFICATDVDWARRGEDRVIGDLERNWPKWGHMVASVLPRIEMDEQSVAGTPTPGRSDWERWGQRIRSIIGDEVPLWCHFTPDRYWKVDGYDGCLYQAERNGHDGKRGPQNHEFETVSDQPYTGTYQDRLYKSPFLSAKDQGWVCVWFEVCQLADDTHEDHDEVMAACRRGLRKIGMPDRWC